MKKILYLTLLAALVFDFAAGAYLLHLVSTRKEPQSEARSGLAHAQGEHPHSHAKVKPVYAIY